VLGQPHPHTLEELIRECQKCKDSLDDFEAWNSGKNITNSSKELDFVVEPFETPQGWQDQDPKDWTPKHEYGGKRIPIRLQVFMHVLSVLESGVRFGDYKGAHKLDKNDPLWLHAKEVDMLKVVLCRFIKSQLTGQALIDALDKAKDVDKPEPLSLSKADVRAAKIIKALSKGLSEGGDGSASTCTFGFVLQTVLDEAAATEWELEALLDHFHALFASKPVGKAEVIAGRAYTGPLYVKMNGSLRKASKKFGEQAHLKGNSYTNLVYSANSLLRKFSQICIIPPGRKVYRGMSGYRLPDCFLVCFGGGGRGGVDFAFLSTSTKLEVAVSYIGDKAMPILFEFDVGDIDRGASLSFLVCPCTCICIFKCSIQHIYVLCLLQVIFEQDECFLYYILYTYIIFIFYMYVHIILYNKVSVCLCVCVCMCVCVCVVAVPDRGRSTHPAPVLPGGDWRALLHEYRQGRSDGLPCAYQLQPQVSGAQVFEREHILYTLSM